MFEKKEKKAKRFVVKKEQGLGMAGAIQIIVDTVTGINYLCTIGASMSGITPLLDRNGNVVIDDIDEILEK